MPRTQPGPRGREQRRCGAQRRPRGLSRLLRRLYSGGLKVKARARLVSEASSLPSSTGHNPGKEPRGFSFLFRVLQRKPECCGRCHPPSPPPGSSGPRPSCLCFFTRTLTARSQTCCLHSEQTSWFRDNHGRLLAHVHANGLRAGDSSVTVLGKRALPTPPRPHLPDSMSWGFRSRAQIQTKSLFLRHGGTNESLTHTHTTYLHTDRRTEA